MDAQTPQDFVISPMRVLTLPEISFFHAASQPVAFSQLDQVLDPLLDALYEARRLAAICESGPDIVRYYRADGETGLYIMEAGIAVAPGTLPAGKAQVKTLPPYGCAGVLLWGSLAHITQAYTALSGSMQAAGLQHTGEVRESTYSFESPVSPNNLMGIYMAISCSR
jgi:hypothetical protein